MIRKSSGQRGPLSPFSGCGAELFQPLLGTRLFLPSCIPWLSRLVELPNLEVATEQTLTVHVCPAVNSPRGSGPGLHNRHLD